MDTMRKHLRIEVEKLLVAKGADVNARDMYDTTASMLAYGKGHIEIVNLLKEVAGPHAKTVNNEC